MEGWLGEDTIVVLSMREAMPQSTTVSSRPDSGPCRRTQVPSHIAESEINSPCRWVQIHHVTMMVNEISRSRDERSHDAPDGKCQTGEVWTPPFESIQSTQNEHYKGQSHPIFLRAYMRSVNQSLSLHTHPLRCPTAQTMFALPCYSLYAQRRCSVKE